MSDCLDDRSEYGLGLVESGVRDYGDWSRQMRSDLPGNNFTEGDLQRVWNEARLEYAKRLTENGNVVRPASSVFIDRIAGIHGRAGAAKFIGALAKDDGTNPLFDKIAEGKQELTDSEKEQAAKAWIVAASEKAKPTQKASVHPLRDIQDAVKQMRIDMAGKPKLPSVNPVNDVLKAVRDRYGNDAAMNLRKSLRVLGKDDILRKIGTRQELTEPERLKAQQAFSDAANEGWRPNAKQITEASKQVSAVRATARDAAAEELAKARTFEDTMREWGYKNLKTPEGKVDTPKVKSFVQDVSNVRDNNYKEYARLMSNYTKKPVGESWFSLWRAGLISNPLIVPKVALSQFAHFAASELGRAPATLLDQAMAKSVASKTGTTIAENRSVYGIRSSAFRSAVSKGATQGLEGAKVIAHEGDLGLHARGLQIGSKDANIIPSEFSGNFFGTPKGRLAKFQDFANRFGSGWVRGVGKMHAASYYPGKVANFYRDISEQAEIQARAEASRGEISHDNIDARIRELQASPSVDMIDHASHAAEQGTFLNKSAAATWLSSAKNPVLRTLVNWAAPIKKVPINLVSSGIGDYTIGLPKSLVDLAVRKAYRMPLDKVSQQAIAMRFGRGTIGAAGFLAGYLAKQLWPNHIQSPNAKSFDKGSIKVKGFDLASGNIQPTMTPFELGTLAYDSSHGDQKAKTLLADLNESTLGNLPGLDTINNIAEAQESNAKFENFMGEQLATLNPGVVKAIAAYTDKETLGGEHYRTIRPGHPLDYVAKGIPVLREHLPLKSEDDATTTSRSSGNYLKSYSSLGKIGKFGKI